MKPSRQFVIVVATAICVWASTASAWAEGPVDKLKRGIAGLCCGFIEVPATLCEESRHEGLGMGLSVGWFKAGGNFLAREFVGLYEFVTCPIGCPDNYKPYLQPTYPWDRFKSKKEESPVPPTPTIPASTAPAKQD